MEDRFVCQLCSKSFRSMSDLRHHARTHTSRGLECLLCGKMFSELSLLKLHVLAHSSRIYACEFCDKNYSSQFELDQHKQGHIGNITSLTSSETLTIKREVCDEVFVKETSLQSPACLQRRSLKSHVCEVCHKRYASKSGLQTHLVLHTKKKPYVCGLCNKAFSQRFGLRKHFVIHTKEKPQVCEICNRGFATIAQLKTHMDAKLRQTQKKMSK